MIHPTADVSPEASIGAGSDIWHYAQVRESARIGSNCRIGKGVYIDHGVSIGNNVKIQNNVSIFHGVRIEDGVFIGPHVTFTNDRHPRAITPDGKPRRDSDWMVSATTVRAGASIGAGAVIVCGVTIGAWAMVGAGAVVTRDVPEQALVYGVPASIQGWVCDCGATLSKKGSVWRCSRCSRTFQLDEMS